jgi:hypothetical protein
MRAWPTPTAAGALDWLCAAGRDAWLALSPHAGGTSVTIDVDGRVQSFEVQVENGIAYAPVSVASPIFLHIASGAGFRLLGPDGAAVARFTMEGAPSAIGQAEGRCRFEALTAADLRAPCGRQHLFGMAGDLHLAPDVTHHIVPAPHPLPSMRKVDRSMPMYFLPYMLFSTQTP